MEKIPFDELIELQKMAMIEEEVATNQRREQEARAISLAQRQKLTEEVAHNEVISLIQNEIQFALRCLRNSSLAADVTVSRYKKTKASPGIGEYKVFKDEKAWKMLDLPYLHIEKDYEGAELSRDTRWDQLMVLSKTGKIYTGKIEGRRERRYRNINFIHGNEVEFKNGNAVAYSMDAYSLVKPSAETVRAGLARLVIRSQG